MDLSRDERPTARKSICRTNANAQQHQSEETGPPETELAETGPHQPTEFDISPSWLLRSPHPRQSWTAQSRETGQLRKLLPKIHLPADEIAIPARLAHQH